MIAKSYTEERTLAEAEVLHLPDIQFVTYCFEIFGLNRGIYNTIDQWLFEHGFADIVQRRKIIVTFLNDLQAKHGLERNGSILRFGKGGLTKQLYDYVQPIQSI